MSERDVTHRLRRAVKENNLSLVKRLIQRTDMRNPDPGPSRYTSLAWAAVCEIEEVFEYLLLMGHDDDELSKDAEKNTILTLLAGARGNTMASPSRLTPDDADLQGATMRMARLYWGRYPFITDWANKQGRTPLHMAALRGSEGFVKLLCDMGADFDLVDTQGNSPLHYASAWGHIPVVQLLIDRGCSYNMKNNEGFTASDYAYSDHTLEALEETVRTRWETNKHTRINAQRQARMLGTNVDPGQLDELQKRVIAGMNRLRSGSATTSASDSTDYEGALSTSAPGSSQFSGHSSSGSLPRAPPSNGTILTPIPSSSNRARNTSTSSSHAPSHSSRPSISSSNTTNGRSGSQHSGSTLNVKPGSSGRMALSPIASRMLEKDTRAMAEYRVRSGSHSSTTTGETSISNPALSTAPPYIPPPPTGPPPAPPDQISSDIRAKSIPRSLRPSLSAASLRQSPIPALFGSTAAGSNPRIRAGTLNNVPGSGGTSTPKTPPAGSSILQTLKRPVMAVLPVGRATETSNQTQALHGHSRGVSGSLLRDIAAMRTDSM